MRLQAQEELQHALKFYDFINERGGTVILTQVEAPQTQWASPVAAFEDTYAHERQISGRIDRLVDLTPEVRHFVQFCRAPSKTGICKPTPTHGLGVVGGGKPQIAVQQESESDSQREQNSG